MEGSNLPRVRMNVKQSAKGAIQFDITTETGNVEESAKLLGQAIDRVKVEVESRGYALSKNGE